MAPNQIDLPPELHRGYARDARGSWYRDRRIQANIQTHQRAIRFALDHLSPDDGVLDVASGTGAFLHALVDAGFARAAGTTWNDRCDVDVPLYRVDLDREFAPEDVGGKYRLITALEVIEHVENPAALLRSCAAVVEPNGWVIISTPNVESVPARMQWLLRGCPWSFMENEVQKNRHIAMIWGRGLRHLARGAGLDVVSRHGDGETPARVRAAIYRLLERVLPGEPHGLQSHYILRPALTRADLGPQAVY